MPIFLPHGLTSGKARHQGPRRVRQGSLEPVHDGSAHMIFQGRVVHILVEAPVVEAFVVESTIPINPTTGMVQRCTMALDCWFPAAQPNRSQAAPQPTPQQTTLLAPVNEGRNRGVPITPQQSLVPLLPTSPLL